MLSCRSRAGPRLPALPGLLDSCRRAGTLLASCHHIVTQQPHQPCLCAANVPDCALGCWPCAYTRLPCQDPLSWARGPVACGPVPAVARPTVTLPSTRAPAQVREGTSYPVRLATAHPIYENWRVRHFRRLLAAGPGPDAGEQLALLGELMFQARARFRVRVG